MSFKRLDQEDISISAESVVAPLFSNGAKYLTSFHTSSNQAASSTGNFYYQVYHQDPQAASTQDTAEIQFSIAYADKDGKGSEDYNTSVSGKSPSATIYGQYRNLVLGDEEQDVKFGGVASDYFYAISINRARYKEKLLPGSFNLKLDNGDGKVLHLTDNSQDITTVSYTDAGRVYEVISGSNGTKWGGTDNGYYSSTVGSYGKFLPDVGVILLNGKALDEDSETHDLALGTARGTDSNGDNIAKISTTIMTGASGSLQSEETVSSNFIFVRVRNSEFNYSTNPSNITGSGELRHDVMINSPQSYITAVGLYNDSNDLLAIAKLSRPLLKDFTKEALIRIKLDY